MRAASYATGAAATPPYLGGNKTIRVHYVQHSLVYIGTVAHYFAGHFSVHLIHACTGAKYINRASER